MEEKITVKVKDFNLDHIFDCGQCFRWEKEQDGSYSGIAYGNAVNMSMEYDSDNAGEQYSGTLTISGAKEASFNKIWKEYLDLDRDYESIKYFLGNNDKVMAEAIASGQGIRILRQEPCETVISFIVSQNNNIPRIKKCIEGLCRNFGENIGSFRGREYYAFPTVDTLSQATENDLAPIKLGYRAKYIIETSKALAKDKNGLKQAMDSSYEEAYEYLTGLCGVGPKVANCIALFGLNKLESFPIDVWMRRVMNRMYGIDENNMKAMKEYAEKNYGEYGGIAQQYLFYHIRQLD